MRCEQSDCPCYGREAVRCWQWAGTRCRGEVQGGFVQKFNACEQCRFYQDIVSDPVCRIGEEFNHMVFILAEKKRELAQAYDELKGSQAKLLQQEKMASIGQLAAGVAHEINNPMGFVTSNLGSLGKYLARLEEFLVRQSEVVARCAASVEGSELAELRKALKVDFILHDASSLIRESLDGAARVRTIVQNLKSFSRVDQAQECSADINRCLEDTINIVWNELKYKCEVKKEYGDLPPTYCFPQQLNQVFMNLLVNAAQAIAERGTITIRTWQEGDEIRVAVGDSGCGIPPENLSRLFEPFFTTKEVGKGTGLGLSITYDIVKKHGGRIEVASEPGKGATFTVCLPIRGEAHGE
jgi:two-component system NtrC family sensor kinase